MVVLAVVSQLPSNQEVELKHLFQAVVVGLLTMFKELRHSQELDKILTRLSRIVKDHKASNREIPL